MTCEIAIMNLNAITLAADSSTTVRRWVNGKEEQRFFKGANKIFQLSESEPVGVMIYGGASLQDIPWEIVVKEFRKHLGQRSFPDLNGYADAFFKYTAKHGSLFPVDYRERIFIDEAVRAAYSYIYAADQQDSIKQAQTDTERKQAYRDYFDSVVPRIDSNPIPSQLNQQDLDLALQDFAPTVAERLSKLVPADINSSQLSVLAIKALLKHFGAFKNSTGIVVAG